MALPQKALEQLAREPVQTPGWSGRLIMVTSTLFFIALAIYLGLYFGYQPYLKRQVDALEARVQKLVAEIPLEEQEKIINFYSQVANLRTILDAQELTSLLLPWLEAHTHVDVTLPSFSFGTAKNQISLAARARTLQAVAEQVALFEQLPEVVSVTFAGTSADKEGFWGFGLVIHLDEAFLSAGALPPPPSEGESEAPPPPPEAERTEEVESAFPRP
jgi:hypothetical protein